MSELFKETVVTKLGFSQRGHRTMSPKYASVRVTLNNIGWLYKKWK